MNKRLWLVKVPLSVPALCAIARRRGLPLEALDDGYFTHCLLTELWGEVAPQPFMVKGATAGLASARAVDVWGYVEAEHDAGMLLRERASEFGDPQLIGAVDGGLAAIQAREVPAFEVGRRVGFLLRACPVERSRKGGERIVERDAYLAARLRNPADSINREQVYLNWLRARLTQDSGAVLEQGAVAGIHTRQLLRRTQGEQRRAKYLERPDVQFEGELRVTNSEAFLTHLSHGVGRHRAFGFGLMLLVPPRGAR